MRRILSGVLALSILVLGACQGPGGTPTLETDNQKASYGIGLQMGAQLAPTEALLDMNAFRAGIRDGMAGNEPAIPQGELQVVIQTFSEAVSAQESERMAVEAEVNATEGEAFLAENAGKEGVTVTESGLQYEVIREGDGARPSPEDRVSLHYKGTLIDGTQFDSSYDRGEPAVFGVGGVIAGFSEGLQLMSVGSHYRFFIPADLGYGPQGTAGDIGPNATLIFELELLEIVQ